MTAGFPLGAAITLAQLEADPHPALARLRAHEPVSWLPALDGWIVTRRDLVLQAMRDPETFTVDDPRFSTAQVVGPSMLSLDGSSHRRQRDPFADPFRLDAVRARFTAIVDNGSTACSTRSRRVARPTSAPSSPARSPSSRWFMPSVSRR